MRPRRCGWCTGMASPWVSQGSAWCHQDTGCPVLPMAQQAPHDLATVSPGGYWPSPAECPVPLAGSQLRPEEGNPLPEGKVKVKLDHDGTVLEVEEDDVEKVGPQGGGRWGRPPFPA